MAITRNSETGYDWGLSRIGVQVRVDPTTQDWYELEIPNMVTINATNDQDPLDGLENHNAGYIYKPQRFTFTVSVPVNSPSYRYLRKLLLNRFQFEMQVVEDISLHPQQNENPQKEYQGIKEILGGCVIDDMNEPIRVGELPVVTFNGKALRFRPIEDPDNTSGVPEYSDGYGSNNFPETDIEPK